MNPLLFAAGAGAAALVQWPVILALQVSESLAGDLALTALALAPPWAAASLVARGRTEPPADPRGTDEGPGYSVLRALRLAGWAWLALSALRIFLTDARALSGPEEAFWLCLTTALPPYVAVLWLRMSQVQPRTIARFPHLRVDMDGGQR